MVALSGCRPGRLGFILGLARAPRESGIRSRLASLVGRGCEAGVVAEEAAEVGRFGEAMCGDRLGGPPGVAE